MGLETVSTWDAGTTAGDLAYYVTLLVPFYYLLTQKETCNSHLRSFQRTIAKLYRSTVVL